MLIQTSVSQGCFPPAGRRNPPALHGHLQTETLQLCPGETQQTRSLQSELLLLRSKDFNNPARDCCCEIYMSTYCSECLHPGMVISGPITAGGCRCQRLHGLTAKKEAIRKTRGKKKTAIGIKCKDMSSREGHLSGCILCSVLLLFPAGRSRVLGLV